MTQSNETKPDADAGPVVERGVRPLDPERAALRKQWAEKLRGWATQARQQGRVYALVHPQECDLIATYLDEWAAELQRLTEDLRKCEERPNVLLTCRRRRSG